MTHPPGGQFAYPEGNRESIVGTDDRVAVQDTTEFPFSAVAHVEAQFPTGFAATGSGMMISDSHLLTAAHVVFDPRFGGMADTEVTPGRDGNATPFGQSADADIWVPEEFRNNDDSRYDFAIVELEVPLGEFTGSFDFISTEGMSIVGQDVQVAGFPADLSFNGPRMFTGEDVVARADGNIIRHYADTSGGMSGGPLTMDIDGDPTVVGVHTTGSGGFFPNGGVRITDEIADILDTAINFGIDAIGQEQPMAQVPLDQQVRDAFDANFYLANNPDVAAAVAEGRMTAFQHYTTWGWEEGRDPNSFFDVTFYLDTNPDVAAAGMEPLLHFIAHGEEEGRAPNREQLLARQNEDALAELDDAAMAVLADTVGGPATADEVAPEVAAMGAVAAVEDDAFAIA